MYVRRDKLFDCCLGLCEVNSMKLVKAQAKVVISEIKKRSK